MPTHTSSTFNAIGCGFSDFAASAATSTSRGVLIFDSVDVIDWHRCFVAVAIAPKEPL